MSNKNLEIEFSERIQESQGIIHKVSRMYCDNEEHRKDLFQEILIQLWKSYPSFRGDSKFSTWMYRVALNVAIQDLRKTKKKKHLFFQTNQFKDASEESKIEVQDEKLKLMHKAIASLNKVEKAIVMLHLDGKSNEEISEIVGITQNYVRVKMNRIKTKLSKTVKNK
ncbi:sigma-70 family RNA polymerase sigma factor [Aggregatimonas sangjinii]|uniref:Sigma-70 family RNA polymerase sigma factor n=1 Tax=Aggregatimonas sangjinii TaxID=2583587 RepID=A0A5B7SQZ3_9FLAO|nr:sigma-70 family RNA polymerase sigma factor [Aggregatimonas sangjinii]QCW99063.1 sigma-70 family RNA polymerase sigma factor [Aggregatimonas sangjinii]